MATSDPGSAGLDPVVGIPETVSRHSAVSPAISARVQHHAPGRAEVRTPAYARMEGVAACAHTRATCGAAPEERS
jgi:hypothetical protein